MKKTIKRLFLGLLIIVGLILISSVVIAAFFEDQISARLLTEINKQLDTELTVEDFELSLLSGFPQASANLKNVVLKDKMNGRLLEAENLSFRFGLLSLFGSSIKVNSVVISDGALKIFTNRKGRRNYDVMKKQTGVQKASAKPKDFALSLEKAKLENVELIYIDDRTKQEMKVQLKEAFFSGNFSNNDFSLDSDAKLVSEFIEIDGVRYLIGKALNYGANIDVNLKDGIYTFKDVELMIESNTFNVDGTITTKKDYTNYDLTMTNKEGNLESIFKLLPDEYLKYFSDFKTVGRFVFNTTIKGKQSASESPAINMLLSLKDGKISSDRLDTPLKDVSFKAKFTNGKSHTRRNSVFSVKDFKAYFNRELLESFLEVTNLDQPVVNFQIDGVIPLSATFGLLNSKAVTDGDGEIEISNFKMYGRYQDLINPSRINRVSTSGVIEFDDAALTINKEDMLVDRGRMILEDNELKVNQVKIEGAGSEILLNGKLTNLFPVLFADSLNSKNAELKFTASLDAKEMDLDRLWQMTKTPVDQKFSIKGLVDSTKIIQTQKREQFTKFLKGTFKANIENLNYNKIEGQDFEGDLVFDNNEVLINGDVETMNGTMNVEGKAFFKERPYLQASLFADHIDAREFFRQSENFGQDVLKYKHVKGVLDSHMAIYAFWDEQGNFLDDKLHVYADVKITDGELIRFKMLEDFSSYVKIKDLRHIKFSNMENWLEVKNSIIYLPVMFIQSNALNLTLNGQHSFENDIDYKVKVNAGQVILNRFKKHDARLKPQKAKRRGWFNIYYHIKGSLDDYEIKTNKKLVKADFIRSERKKREIQKVLLREFGNVKSIEEPLEWRDAKPNRALEHLNEQDLEFIDGFEEEDLPPNNNTTANKTKPKKEQPKVKPFIKKKPAVVKEEADEEEEFLDVFDDLGDPKKKKEKGKKKEN